MGVRRKRGNRKRKKVKETNDFYNREKKLNRMIKKFINNYYQLSYPPSAEDYDEMNHQRIEIKRLFNMQQGEVWKQSRRRKRFYYNQLDTFKYYYTAWKHLTYYIFLEKKYDMPLRYCHNLSSFKKNNINLNAMRYQL